MPGATKKMPIWVKFLVGLMVIGAVDGLLTIVERATGSSYSSTHETSRADAGSADGRDDGSVEADGRDRGIVRDSRIYRGASGEEWELVKHNFYYRNTATGELVPREVKNPPDNWQEWELLEPVEDAR